MTFLDKINDRIHILRDAATAKMPAVFTITEIREYRMAICKSCEFYFSPTGQCKKCGCFVKAKTAIASSRCPVFKWADVPIDPPSK